MPYRFGYTDVLPPLGQISLRIAIFVGNHSRFTSGLTEAVDAFCEKYGAVVFCDNTSGYNGRFKVLLPLLSSQSQRDCEINHVGLLIHIGEVSRSIYEGFSTRSVAGKS